MSSGPGFFILSFYPRAFRRSCGADAVQLIEDRWRDEQSVRQRLRLCGDLAGDIASAWLRTLQQSGAARDAQPANQAMLFGFFERETALPGAVVPGMLFSLAAMAVLMTLLDPQNCRDFSSFLRAFGLAS